MPMKEDLYKQGRVRSDIDTNHTCSFFFFILKPSNIMSLCYKIFV